MTTTPNPVYVALDTPDVKTALALAGAVRPHVGGLKVGLEFVSANGPEGVRAVAALGLPVFLDVKLHDIPNTVAGAVRALSGLGVSIINVHASGGTAMMRAAKEAAGSGVKIIAVTILTSLDDADMEIIGYSEGASMQALRLARLAQISGLDGVVCAATDLAAIRAACGPDFLTIVPGSRPAGSDVQDQKRFMTPSAARTAGADILILGRPVTAAADPAAAARAVAAELGFA
ncbi:MAG: orotidine-5'-phosphate decarboxylase [Alphaproteobacteria bacterium]